ncbi:transposase, partial [Mordavella massiliensis]|uniref:transposase n=1 Tax=Mordavella massiliensis TaxID=1871024 RepID=UPI00195EBFBB
YIQNSWKYGKSNGLSEGLNNKIKVLKRVSFGLHSFESFRRRILLTCGKLKLSKDPQWLFAFFWCFSSIPRCSLKFHQFILKNFSLSWCHPKTS